MKDVGRSRLKKWRDPLLIAIDWPLEGQWQVSRILPTLWTWARHALEHESGGGAKVQMSLDLENTPRGDTLSLGATVREKITRPLGPTGQREHEKKTFVLP
jgi:hypothetical protein